MDLVLVHAVICHAVYGTVLAEGRRRIQVVLPVIAKQFLWCAVVWGREEKRMTTVESG
jgi:hypothetical protein